jgi:serine/threonine protein phosphatase 1
VIGDIHGCLKALDAILGAVKPISDDTIVVLGDFIDRGIDTKGVIDRLIELSSRCRLVVIRGNHEETMLDALHDSKKLDRWLRFGGEVTLMSYGEDARLDLIPEEHISFLRDTRGYFESDSHIFTHASFIPNRPMKEHPSSVLRWESLDPEHLSRHYSGKTVVVGHTVQENGEVLDLGFVICLDTGCYCGGWLTGLDVNSGQVWQANEHGRLRER